MREDHQHREIISRIIQPEKQAFLGEAIVDNRDTPQTRLMGRMQTIQQKPNNTGLPINLKSGVENLSGFSMDDVKVHYNSDKPAQIQAHAYTQGTDIHVATGQEKHLPHEVWHVVQQMQGRVQPTMQRQQVKNMTETGWMAVQRSPISSSVNVVQMQPLRGEDFGYDYNTITSKGFRSGLINKLGNIMQINSVNNNGFHLGWSSLMGFETKNNEIQFNVGRKNVDAIHLKVPNDNNRRSQIVTRGVSSCSVIIVRDEMKDKNFMGHFNSTDLKPENMTFITNQVPYRNVDIKTVPMQEKRHYGHKNDKWFYHPNIFASIPDKHSLRKKERSPAKFTRNLITKYYPGLGLDDTRTGQGLIPYLTNGVPSGHNIRILDRTADGEGMFSHAEIGLSVDKNKKFEIFGSLDDLHPDVNGNKRDLLIDLNAKQSAFNKQARIGRSLVNEGGCGFCYITTACVEQMGLADDCEELTVLREFRDIYLLKKENGKELIQLYYKHAPEIVARIRRREDEEEILLRLYGIIRQCVDAIKRNDYEYAYVTYCTMVNNIKEEF